MPLLNSFHLNGFQRVLSISFNIIQQPAEDTIVPSRNPPPREHLHSPTVVLEALVMDKLIL